MGAGEDDGGGGSGKELSSESIHFQEPKPTTVYIPGSGADATKQIRHGKVTHNAVMAFIGYGGRTPPEDIVKSHVERVYEEMRRNGHKSPLFCLVGTDLWTDVPLGYGNATGLEEVE